MQAGPVCSLEHLSTECLFKDTNVCCFCKNENLSTETFCKSYYLVCANWACLLLCTVVTSFVAVFVYILLRLFCVVVCPSLSPNVLNIAR